MPGSHWPSGCSCRSRSAGCRRLKHHTPEWYFVQSSPQELTKALALYAAAALAGGAAAGVFLGGMITECIGWPWVFYIIPIAAIILALVPSVMPGGVAARQSRAELPGAATTAGGLAAAVYAVVQAAEVGWGAPGTWLELGLAAALLGAAWIPCGSS